MFFIIIYQSSRSVVCTEKVLTSPNRETDADQTPQLSDTAVVQDMVSHDIIIVCPDNPEDPIFTVPLRVIKEEVATDQLK